MAGMNDYVLFNAAIDAAGLTTPAYPLGANNNAVSVTLTVVAGTTPTNTLTAQQSNDGVTWTTFVASTGFDGKTGPDLVSGVFGSMSTVFTMKYARFLINGPASGFMIVNLSMYAYRAA